MHCYILGGTEKTVLEGRHHEEQKESELEEESAKEEKTQNERSLERDQGEPEKPDKEIVMYLILTISQMFIKKVSCTLSIVDRGHGC